MASLLDVFQFAVAKDPVPFERYVPAQRRINASRAGSKFALTRGDVLEFRGLVVVAFPQPPDVALDFSDMLAFVDDHKSLSFLVMPYTGPSLRQETKLFATDGTTKLFATNHKYLDSSLVKVYLDDVEQLAGWTLVNNNVTPVVSFTSAPATGQTLKIVAQFLVPCHMVKNPLREGEGLADHGRSETEDTSRSFEFEFVEIEPGARFVNPTGMSGA